TLYFAAAKAPGEVVNLWTTAGSPGSARELTTVWPGPASCPQFACTSLGRLGAAALFFAAAGDSWSLWRSDGTAAGTRSVRQVCAGFLCNLASGFLAHDGLVYFAVSDDAGVTQLWRSDGSGEGTFPLTHFGTGQQLDLSYHDSLGEDLGSGALALGFS